MWRWLLLLTVAVSVIASTFNIRPVTHIKRSHQKYCGPDIYYALQILCKGIYNPMFKKSYIGDDGNTDLYLPNEEDYEIKFPYSSKKNALSFLSGNYIRQERGVHDECCRKSCSLSELTGYCGQRN